MKREGELTEITSRERGRRRNGGAVNKPDGRRIAGEKKRRSCCECRSHTDERMIWDQIGFRIRAAAASPACASSKEVASQRKIGSRSPYLYVFFIYLHNYNTTTEFWNAPDRLFDQNNYLFKKNYQIDALLKVFTGLMRLKTSNRFTPLVAWEGPTPLMARICLTFSTALVW